MQNVERRWQASVMRQLRSWRDAKRDSACELEDLRAALAEREAAARAEIDKATALLEGVQKQVMLQAKEANTRSSARNHAHEGAAAK
ncbi:hypothetical protein CTP10_R79830 (plasmid) [Cupriavidus sp. P-10]|uniref:hypothetical protein n=1 Tax=unclassified Cupriavidus TaxID=2640874 RepID=UPI0011C1C336|nr:hypothetical protein [Cupriavidus sp. P-10]BDB30566.1 hypothetical protein CTP10_R79830 [Cupriavidus sp. P-10]